MATQQADRRRALGTKNKTVRRYIIFWGDPRHAPPSECRPLRRPTYVRTPRVLLLRTVQSAALPPLKIKPQFFRRSSSEAGRDGKGQRDHNQKLLLSAHHAEYSPCEGSRTAAQKTKTHGKPEGKLFFPPGGSSLSRQVLFVIEVLKRIPRNLTININNEFRAGGVHADFKTKGFRENSVTSGESSRLV